MLVSGSTPPVPCGVGDYTHRLAQALAGRGATVSLLTSGDAADALVARTYEVLPAMTNWRGNDWRAVMRALQAWRPSIVHLQYPTQGYGDALLPSTILLLARLAGAVPVRTWHEGFHQGHAGRFGLQWLAGGPSVTVRPNYANHLWRPLRSLVWRRPPTLITGASAIPPSTMTHADRQAARYLLLEGRAKLLVSFGFLYPSKGVEAIFSAGRPERDAIRIAGAMHVDEAYTDRLEQLAATPAWRGHASLLGFLDERRTADLLRAADVVVLPFRQGGGSWNSSIHAAVLQGTPVVTTSRDRIWHDAERNVWYVPPNDTERLRVAIDAALANDRRPDAGWLGDDWVRIANEHLAIYQRALGKTR